MLAPDPAVPDPDDDEPLAPVFPLFGDAGVGEPAAEPGLAEEQPAAHDLLDEPGEPEPRRYPSTIGGAFYIVILITAGAALALVMGHDWRLGVKVLAVALGAAGALRLVLPERDAGMLAVRPRFVDVFLLVGVAALLFWLASSIPDQPPV